MELWIFLVSKIIPVLLHVIECPRIKNPSHLHVVVPFFIIFKVYFYISSPLSNIETTCNYCFLNILPVNQEPLGSLQTVIINNHHDWPPTVTACQFRLGLEGSGSPFSTVFFPYINHQSIHGKCWESSSMIPFGPAQVRFRNW